MNKSNKHPRFWKINTDGAIRPQHGISGLAAIVRDENDQIRYWWQRRAGALTCNEAEYAAVIFGLEKILGIPHHSEDIVVDVYCASRGVVAQMNGSPTAQGPARQKARARLRHLITQFQKVTFQHISREQNRLADALAFEAVEGTSRERRKAQKTPNIDLWEQFISPWREP